MDPPEVGEVGPSFIYEVGYRIRRMASNFERAIKMQMEFLSNSSPALLL